MARSCPCVIEGTISVCLDGIQKNTLTRMTVSVQVGIRTEQFRNISQNDIACANLPDNRNLNSVEGKYAITCCF